MLFQLLQSSDLEQYLFQQHGERATGEKTQQLETHMSLFNMVELDFEASQYLSYQNSISSEMPQESIRCHGVLSLLERDLQHNMLDEDEKILLLSLNRDTPRQTECLTIHHSTIAPIKQLLLSLKKLTLSLW